MAPELKLSVDQQNLSFVDCDDNRSDVQAASLHLYWGHLILCFQTHHLGIYVYCEQRLLAGNRYNILFFIEGDANVGS